MNTAGNHENRGASRGRWLWCLAAGARVAGAGLLGLLLGGVALAMASPPAAGFGVMTQPPADHRVPYGEAAAQFGELYLPARSPVGARAPVVLLLHGGCWRARWGLDQVRSLAAALAAEGFAVWSLEYRRLGEEGGGWPGTFADVARGADHLRRLAERFALDLGRVVAVGHSAGGHLALWLAGRHRLAPDSPLYAPDPLALRGVVALAPIADLAAGAAAGVCGEAIAELLGGRPDEIPERVRQASPAALLPLGVRLRLVAGERDTIVRPGLVAAFAEAARRAGDDVGFTTLSLSGHFELVDPRSPAWPAVRDAVREVAGGAP